MTEIELIEDLVHRLDDLVDILYRLDPINYEGTEVEDVFSSIVYAIQDAKDKVRDECGYWR